MSCPGPLIAALRSPILLSLLVVVMLASPVGGLLRSRSTSLAALEPVDGRAVAVTPAASGVPAVPHPLCSGPNTSFTFSWTAPGNYSNVTQPGEVSVGPVPGNISVELLIDGPLAPYSWYFGWGDGTNNSAGLYNKTTVGLSIVNVSHYYALPAIYWVVISANFSCPWGGGGWGTGGQLNAFGPGGPQPINATTNVSRGLVPLDVAYTASVAAAPANATAELSIWGPAIFGMLQIASPVPSSGNLSFDAQLTAPGDYQGFLQVYYPGSPPVYGPSNSSLYAEAYLPIINVTPAAVLNVSHTTPVGLSPWNLTWWANATNLSGGTYAGNGTIEWGFTDAYPGWNGSANPWQWATGPTVGSPVNRTYYLNQSGAWPVEATANLVDPAGITEAIASAGFFLGNNTGPPWNGSTLLLNSSVNNGSTPLHFNLTAQLLPAPGANITNTQLDIAAFNGSGVIAWNSTTYNWTGSPITIPGTLTVPGQYYVLAAVYSIVPITNGTWIANANVTLTVLPAVVGPPSISFSASPSAGGAPLNVTIDLVASGGTAPYSLSVCQEGPFSSPNGTAACAPIGSATAWNGSAVSMSTSLNSTGNYTILATLTDAASQTSNASAGIVVAPPIRLAPLTAHASYVAPSAISTEGATYGFLTGVSGGEAPYSIQWSFGDGAMGSAVPGGTTVHTFMASGTYFVTLTVTDARGTQVRSSVGPIVVALPAVGAGSTPWPSAGTTLALAAVVAIASIATLVAALGRVVQRRQALNWFRAIEERNDSGPGRGA